MKKLLKPHHFAAPKMLIFVLEQTLICVTADTTAAIHHHLLKSEKCFKNYVMTRNLGFCNARLLRKLEKTSFWRSEISNLVPKQALVWGTDDDTTTIVYHVVLYEKC